MSGGLSKAQKRHLCEMVGPESKSRYWRPRNAGEASCALALRRRGLLAGSAITHSDAYTLTDEGMRVALLLIASAPAEKETR